MTMGFTVEREIAEVMDWYQVHRIVEGYKKMLKLLRDDMLMDNTYEVYFEQNVDSGNFRAEVVSIRDLGTERGIRDIGADVRLAFDIAMYTRTTPTQTENGLFGVLELNAIAKLLVDMPGKKDSRTHKFFRKIWHDLLFRDQFRYWAEVAEEELLAYINEMRNFYGLEPTTGKTERLSYEPLVGGYV